MDKYDYYYKSIDLGIKGKFEEAKIAIEKALEIDKFFKPARGGTKIIENALSQNRKKETVCILKGIKLGNRKKLRKAELEFKKAIEIDPSYDMAYIELGVLYSDNGMMKSAIQEYEKAIDINPNSIEAHDNLGVTYYHSGLFDKAIEEYKIVLNLGINDAEIHFQLGGAYSRKGLLDNAIEEFYSAFELVGNDTKLKSLIHNGLGLVYKNKKMIDKAIEEFNQAISINPKNAVANNNMAELYCDIGKPDLAVMYCKEALAYSFHVRPELIEKLQPYWDDILTMPIILNR